MIAIKPLARAMIMVSTLVTVSSAIASTGWRPMPGEQLIKLPAPVMAQAIERDFRESPLAAELQNRQQEIEDIQSNLGELKEAITSADGEKKVELQHSFLEEKSAYLDTMEIRQELKKGALKSRINLYNQALNELKQDRTRASDPVSREIREAQMAARQRMQRVTGKVDEMFYPAIGGETSRYNQEYAQNVNQIKALQRAIRSHTAHESARIDGAEVSREDFIRDLLTQAEAEHALIDQESEMLGFMARLVALDAQALQMQIAYGEEFEAGGILETGKPASMVDLFIN
jgi:hypothetical protein